jgi:arsenate reductase
MAEALLRERHGERFEAYSAGVEPQGLNPFAVAAMKEIGIDISHQRSKHIGEFKGVEFDQVVTVCDHAREVCPNFPQGKERIHKGFEDPARAGGEEERRTEVFRRIRDEIKEWIDHAFSEESDDH